MKKLIVSSSIVAMAIFATGCVGPNGPLVGTVGGIYSNVSGPVAVTSNTGASKMGSATSEGLLGFAWGDSSIKAAAAAGGITKVQHVDYHVTSVLGVYCETTVTVYGE